MNKKLMILLGLTVLECSARQKRLREDDDIEGRPERRPRVNHAPNLAMDNIIADLNLLTAMINDEQNNLQQGETLITFFGRYQPQGLQNDLNNFLQNQLLQGVLHARLENEAYFEYWDALHEDNTQLVPNDTLGDFFARYPVQNPLLPLNVLNQGDRNDLQSALAERLQNEAYVQYHAVLTDENNQLRVNDTLENFFARHPVQNPLLPLAALANNRALQEALDDRLDEELDEGIQE